MAFDTTDPPAPLSPALPPERVLLARALDGDLVVLTTDSAAVAADVDSVSSGNYDLGIVHDDSDVRRHQLVLWTGHTVVVHDGDDSDPYRDYRGSVRPVEPAELFELLEMCPPEPDFDPDDDR